MCLAGAFGAGAELLAATPDSRVHAYYVWVPMLPSGDGDRLLARRMAVELAIDSRRSAGAGDEPPFAWDVYLAYRRGNRDITQPDFWMHQLAVEHAPRFDSDAWQRRITEMLGESGV